MVSGTPVLSMLLEKLYALRIWKLRKVVLFLVTKLEGGQHASQTLRRIYRNYYHIDVGLHSYGCFVPGRIAAYTKIGRYCSFAEGVCIMNRNHPIEFKSTHPYFFSTRLPYVKKELIPMREIVIGNDVWFGYNALVLPSVTKIGDGAVIGAGAVVTKDVPDYAVVAGNPARVVKYRFSEETRLKIKSSKWWNKDIEKLRKDLEEFTRPC